MWKSLRVASATARTVARRSLADSTAEQPWKDPWKRAIPQQTQTETEFEEVAVDWKYVERLLPKKTIPEPVPRDSYPTPSGWQPPKDPPPDLPYFIRRRRDHLLPLFLERRRDLLNETTLDFDYVELVAVRNVTGDVFACEADLREFLERELGHPVATHVDELKGRIKVKGADRAVIEKFFFEKGF